MIEATVKVDKITLETMHGDYTINIEANMFEWNEGEFHYVTEDGKIGVSAQRNENKVYLVLQKNKKLIEKLKKLIIDKDIRTQDALGKYHFEASSKEGVQSLVDALNTLLESK